MHFLCAIIYKYINLKKAKDDTSIFYQIIFPIEPQTKLTFIFVFLFSSNNPLFLLFFQITPAKYLKKESQLIDPLPNMVTPAETT